MTALQKQIRLAALAQNITITELASRLGISRQYLGEMMRGTRRFRAKYRQGVAAELGVTEAWLTGEVGR